MYRRHHEVPIFEQRQVTVPATHHNQVSGALRHRRVPALRFELPRLRSLDLIVQPDAWIVVDRGLNDLPVLAWCDFDTSHRDSLHQPIPCHLNLYHGHAGILLKRILEALALLLGEREPEPGPESRVVPFRAPPRS